MIPYQGSKRKIANDIIRVLPSAENFYDLFGGGGTISEEAAKCRGDGLFGKWEKWKNIHYNELNTGVYLLNNEIWSGKFDIEKAKKAWVSREMFFAEKDKPTAWGAFIRFCWSFGNDGDSYIYGDCEVWKKQVWELTYNNDNFLPNLSPKNKRLMLNKSRINLLKNVLSCPESIESIERIERIESIERIERIQSIESIERIERIQSIERIESIQSIESIESTNLDYRDVEIKPNSVVYCDIPYDCTADCYGVKFDYAAFFDWAASRDFPVYFSEYNCKDERFVEVWSKNVLSSMGSAQSKHGAFKTTERLFWNGIGI